MIDAGQNSWINFRILTRALHVTERVIVFLDNFAEAAEIEFGWAAQPGSWLSKQLTACAHGEEARKGFEAGLRFGRNCVISSRRQCGGELEPLDAGSGGLSHRSLSGALR